MKTKKKKYKLAWFLLLSIETSTALLVVAVAVGGCNQVEVVGTHTQQKKITPFAVLFRTDAEGWGNAREQQTKKMLPILSHSFLL